MAELIATRGLPASGKSTWAMDTVKNDHLGTVRVNRDLLRKMVNAGVWKSKDSEKPIIQARDALIKEYLRRNLCVINDDTNLDPKVLAGLERLALKEGAGFRVVDFDVPLEVCLERDFLRMDRVGEEVIQGMYKRYFRGGLFPSHNLTTSHGQHREPYDPNPLLPRAAIVDLDGTIAIHNRSPYDYSRVATDSPNYVVTDVIESLYESGYWIVFVSGRPDSCERETRDWLDLHVAIGNYDLFMRKTGDDRNDAVIKYEIFDAKIRDEWNVRFCIDDRQRVIDMWRSIGLTVFDVAGNTF